MKKLEEIQAQYATAVCAVLKKDGTAKDALGLDPATARPGNVFQAFFEHTDPSALRGDKKSGKFLPWICAQYLSLAGQEAPLKAEDFYKLREDLRAFEARTAVFVRNGQPSRIEDIPSLPALQEQLRPYQQKAEARREASRLRHMTEDQHRRIMDESTIFYDGPEGKIIMPHTQKASQHWGAQTRWCISATKSENHFDSHNARVPIVMYFPRVPKAERALWPAYKSFKFAGVANTIYDENDKSGNKTHPAALKTLAVAALNALDPVSAAVLRDSGAASLIEAAGTAPPLDDPCKKPPANPAWDSDNRRILDHFCKFNDDTMDKFPGHRDNRDFHLYTLKKRAATPFNHLPPGHPFYDDEELLLLAVTEGLGNIYAKASPRLHDSRDFTIKAVQANAYCFRLLQDKWRADRDIAALAVSAQGSNMQYVYPAKRPHDEPRLRSLFRHVASVPWISGLPHLRGDFDLAAVAAKGSLSFQHLARHHRANAALFAASGHYDLDHTAGGLRNDPEICLHAIKANTYNVKHVSSRLRGNREWLMRAVAVEPAILGHIPSSITRDRDFALQLVKINGFALHYLRVNHLFRVEHPYAADREIHYEAISQNGLAYDGCGPEMARDPELAMMGARAGINPATMPSPFQEDPAFWLAAVGAKPQIICDVNNRTPHDIRWNETIVKTAAAADYWTLFNIHARNQSSYHTRYYDPTGDFKFMRDCIMRDSRYLQLARPGMLHDRTLMTDIIRHYGDAGRMAEIAPSLRHYPALWGGDITNLTDPAKAVAKLAAGQITAPPPPRPPVFSL